MSATQQFVIQQPTAMDTHMAALERYLEKAEGAYARNSLKAFRGDIGHYTGWCERASRTPFPAFPETLIAYIESCAGEYARATIDRRIAHLRKAHQVLGLRDPIGDPDVQLAIERMRRNLGAVQAQASPIGRVEVQAINKVMDRRLIDKRDWALLLVTRDLLGRRSEIVSLDVDDISYGEDGSGLAVIHSSKIDQIKTGACLWLSPECVDAIKVWLGASGHDKGPLFRAVKKGGRVAGRLSDRDVARRLKVMAERACIDPEKISGHSPRVGMAQDLAADGASLPNLMLAGRWMTPQMPLRYVRKLKASRGAVAQYHKKKTRH